MTRFCLRPRELGRLATIFIASTLTQDLPPAAESDRSGAADDNKKEGCRLFSLSWLKDLTRTHLYEYIHVYTLGRR